ncbi:hypothetical protein [Psychrobacillus vulpis]|uniref:Uncharacterized protein n=1 Tax=Psychrobacillus vulpis TaxID=2325572 RepID=A0A544TUT1_9BACI|nr:hypothetical protein [Psychrobacillus vulpis]TQR21193.1 hypothetical protein FG384_03010 [Psychrobacillus vulpis]
MIIVDKIQFYIPSLLDIVDYNTILKLEEVSIVGVKTSNIKYFIGYPTQEATHINQIVAEDFTIHDLQLDFRSKTLSFYLESKGTLPKSVILQKVFQTFAVRYSPKEVAFLLYSSGKNRPQKIKIR